MAVVRSCLKAFFPRGPTSLGVRSLIGTLMVVGLLMSVAVAVAVANCDSIISYPPTGSYGGTNPAEPNIHRCYRADPINCATGNLTETHVDLAVQGHGPSLQMVRTYNSQLAANQSSAGPLGYGWTGSYSAKLTFSQEKTVATITHDNGSTINFALSGSTWNTPAWTQATFVQSGETYIYTQPDFTRMEFNSAGRLLKITDRHSISLTLAYNTSGRLESVTDQSSRKLTFTYNTSGQIEKVTDPMGRVVKYTYSSGNLASVTLPGMETARWKFAYNTFHELTGLTNGRGYTTTTAYDSSHRAISQTDPLGRKYTFAYKEASGVDETTVTEPNGAVTVQRFNEAGSPISIAKAVGTSLETKSTYTYNGMFLLTSATDPNGHVTTYSYDSRGNRLSVKDPNGNETKWTYNSTNDIVTSTDPQGQVTQFTRNTTGDPLTVKTVSGSVTQEAKFEYNEYGVMIRKTDPVGRVRSFLVLGLGMPILEYSGVTFSAEKVLRGWNYNGDSEVIGEIDGRGYEPGNEQAKFSTTITRDGQGRPTTITDPLGNTTKKAYDANGNVATATDAIGNTVTYSYDTADQLTEVKAPTGSIRKTAYNSLGKVITQTDGGGGLREFKYDLLGRVIESIDPLGRKTVSEYDAASNLLKTVDPQGRSISYSYDPGDRPTKVDYSEAATADVTFGYDKKGNVTEITDGIGTMKKIYDGLGRLSEVVNGRGETVKYEYNLADQVTKLVYPNGKAVTRGYDNVGRLENVVDWFGKETKFSYYQNSALKSTVFPSETGNVDAYGYDAAGGMTEVVMKKGLEGLASFVYSRDKDGQVSKTIQKGLPEGAEELTFGYDSGNRLTGSDGYLFEYNAGNSPTKNESGAYSFDLASQISAGPEGGFTYDKLGQRIQETYPTGPPINYTYDQAGNLTSVLRTAEGEITAINQTYKHDGTGLRSMEKSNGVSHPWVWDLSSEIPLLLADGWGDKYIYGPGGVPVEQINSKEVAVFLHHDQQGSTRILTGSTGVVEGTYSYKPFGQLKEHTGSAITQLGFAGQYRNHTTRQIYLRARVYDPDSAQFLSVDPMIQQTGEPYNYAEGNPTNRIDPSGERAGGICFGGSISVPFVMGGATTCRVWNDWGDPAAWLLTVSVNGGGGSNYESVINNWVQSHGLSSIMSSFKSSGFFLGGGFMFSNDAHSWGDLVGYFNTETLGYSSPWGFSYEHGHAGGVSTHTLLIGYGWGGKSYSGGGGGSLTAKDPDWGNPGHLWDQLWGHEAPRGYREVDCETGFPL